MATHESLTSSHEVKTSSDKSFGLVFCGFFALVGLLPLLKHHPVRVWALIVSGAFLTLAFVKPSLLHPLNVVWSKFGLLLNKVTNPLIMGVLFYGVMTPVALIMRLAGKDPLRLKRDVAATSYWIERNPPGPKPESMAQQF